MLDHLIFKMTFQLGLIVRFLETVEEREGWAVVSLCTFIVHFRMWWVLVWWGKLICLKEKFFILLLDCKPWFEMVCNAYITMYIIYIRYSILRVFALFVGYFDCLIHILNVSFKIRSTQSIKKWFYICFQMFWT